MNIVMVPVTSAVAPSIDGCSNLAVAYTVNEYEPARLFALSDSTIVKLSPLSVKSQSLALPSVSSWLVTGHRLLTLLKEAVISGLISESAPKTISGSTGGSKMVDDGPQYSVTLNSGEKKLILSVEVLSPSPKATTSIVKISAISDSDEVQNTRS